MRKRSAVMVCLIVLLFCGGLVMPAGAYVITGPHILDLMLKKIGAAKSLSVNQHQVVFHDESSGGRVDYQESLSYLNPDNFRSDVSSGELSKIHVESGGKILKIQNGTLVTQDPEAWQDLYKEILLVRDRAVLQGRLEKIGVDFSVTRLERFDGRICFVIGNGLSFNGGPELWVDKESFKPVKLVADRGNPEGGVPAREIRFHNWQSVGKNFWYPMIVEFYVGDESVRLIEVDKVDMKAVVQKNLFSMEKLRNLYRNSGSLGGESLPEDIDMSGGDFSGSIE